MLVIAFAFFTIRKHAFDTCKGGYVECGVMACARTLVSTWVAEEEGSGVQEQCRLHSHWGQLGV